jgi:hypothetical protein
MSKMPTDRTSDWRRIFDRFGRADGALRDKPGAATAKPGTDPPGSTVGNPRQTVRNGPPVSKG